MREETIIDGGYVYCHDIELSFEILCSSYVLRWSATVRRKRTMKARRLIFLVFVEAVAHSVLYSRDLDSLMQLVTP